jgi:hypothetical protein
VTAALDFLHPAPVVPGPDTNGVRPPLRVVRGRSAVEVGADQIPAQPGPALTVSLTEGCDLPLDALRAAPERLVVCHPCDEAVVTLLLLRARHVVPAPTVSRDVVPGTLRLG